MRRRGCTVLGRNVRAGRGEIVLIIQDGPVLVAVEVKTGIAAADHFDDAKIESLRAAMRRLQPSPRRLDLVIVKPAPGHAIVHWFRNAG